jgi:hypothetical protein
MFTKITPSKNLCPYVPESLHLALKMKSDIFEWDSWQLF